MATHDIPRDPASGATQTRSGERERAISCAATPSINVVYIAPRVLWNVMMIDEQPAYTVIHDVHDFTYMYVYVWKHNNV